MLTREQCQKIVERLRSGRSARETRWRKLHKYICPWRGVFPGRTEDNPTERQMLRFTQCASQAVLRGASGMTTGMTPRNTSWFKPDFIDPQITEASGARAWLDNIDRLVKDCLAAGGFYQAIQSFNTDLLWAGCALLYAEVADDNPLRYFCPQVGTWFVALDCDGRLETVARQASMTPRDLVRIFGEQALTEKTRRMASTRPLDSVRVWQLVHPADTGPHPYASYWWEEGSRDSFLKISGYYEMPFFYTCWHEGVTPYGTGPGDETLPDAMQLDLLERRKLEGLAKLVDPPVQAPTQLKGHIRLQAGDINYLPERQLISPILDLAPFAAALSHLRQEISTVAQRVQQSLMATIFASVSLDQRPPGMSATEFLERKREALQQLGPVISAYEPNVLTPLLFRTLQTIDRAGLTTPPPQSLAGVNLLLKMDFISPMANALRQTSAEATRAIFQEVAAMAQATRNPEVLDKLDIDQAVDELATGIGAPGSIIRADADVAALRQQRAQAQQRQQQLAMQLQQAQAERAQAGAMREEASAAQMFSALAQAQD